MRFNTNSALVSACFLSSVVSAYYPVTGSLPGGIRRRKEINELSGSERDLFILALRNMMDQPENTPYSYFQVAGIHGQPWVAFDNNPADHRGVAQTGYCPHGGSLFGTWHRPYLAQFETALSGNAAAIAQANAQAFPQFTTALPDIRLPYWDWALNSQVPRILTEQYIDVPDLRNPRQRINILNPLYNYQFKNRGSQPFLQVTQRRPDYQQQLQPLAGIFRSAVSALFTTGNVCWKAFISNAVQTEGSCPRAAPFITSLETIHNEVHTRVGGTMAPIETSGFEPIFWLHHTNIDRMMAIWQSIFPNEYVTQTWSALTTFDSGPHMYDANSPLLPFRRSQQPGSWWTSAACRYTGSLGYTYNEINTGFQEGTQQHRQEVFNRVMRLYGNGRTMMALATDESAAAQRQRRDVPSAGPNSLITPPSVEELKPFAKKLLNDDGSFSEYSARISVDKAALPSTFTVSLTLGEGDGVANRAGTFSVLRMSEAGTNMTMDSAPVRGAVVLTDPLLNLLVKGDIKDLAKSTIAEYCRKNLKWKITSVDGKDWSNKAASAELDVAVVHATVTPTDDSTVVSGVKVSTPETVVEITKA